MTDQQPDCCICGRPCEPWSGDPEPYGYGNNPDPFGEEGDRCCNDCNTTAVIPARLGLLRGEDFPTRTTKNKKDD